jgi:hypothetical protein
MKKYTIKEFAEGKKAVKIENEEQWNKLNKVHKLTSIYYGNKEYSNNQEFTHTKGWYERNGWETLDFSQLDFEDEFVVGSWYKITKEGVNTKYIKYLKTNSSGYFHCSEHINSKYQIHGGRFGIDDIKHLTKVSLEEIQPFLPEGHVDLIKKDTFVLPKYWCIKRTKETDKVITETMNKLFRTTYVTNNLGFPWIPNKYDGNDSQISKHEGYTEITFEQFQQYVLKTKKEENMEQIIGYKLVKPEYETIAAQICSKNCNKLYGNVGSKNDIQKLKEAGVLDLWFEPVYSPKYSLPKINGKQCIDNGDKTITCGCTTKSFDWILGVDYAMGEEIDISGTKVSDKEIRQIVEYINNK